MERTLPGVYDLVVTPGDDVAAVVDPEDVPVPLEEALKKEINYGLLLVEKVCG